MRNELLKLREAMARKNIDAYLIPTDDFHGSEYVGDFFRCREYVSGFTGSAGTLIVTADWAGLWTDGRYFLQAAQQLEGSGIDLCKMGQPGVPTVDAWLSDHMSAGMTLGFDGRSMTSGTGKAYKAAMERLGAALVCDVDLVGEIWEDRPPMSEAPVWALDDKYAGRSRREKLEALRADVEKAGADAFVLASLADLAWLLNIRGSDVDCCPVVLGDLLLDADGAWLYVDERKFAPELRAAIEADSIGFRPYLALYEDLKKLPAGSTIMADPGSLNYALLENIPAKVTVLEAQNPTELPKSAKNETECAYERIAHIKDGAALTRFMRWVKAQVGREPISEISAAEKLEEFRRREESYLGPSFEPIMGFGEHGAIIHYSATPETNAMLEPRCFLLSDTGGHYLEGSTDVTRTFALGPLTDEMKYHYTLVLRSHLALAAAIFKSGCPGQSLDYAARKPFWDVGLDYNHGTGHGVGYLLPIHEGPQNIRYGGKMTPVPMAPGMITSDEPGIYLEGQYGIRLENLVLCVEKFENSYGKFLGFEPLTMCPFDLDAIVPQQLSDTEKAQLNAYHQTVYEKLSPGFDEEERAWLKNATRPI